MFLVIYLLPAPLQTHFKFYWNNNNNKTLTKGCWPNQCISIASQIELRKTSKSYDLIRDLIRKSDFKVKTYLAIIK